MNDSNILVSEIELKVRKLINAKNRLADENEKLMRENAGLKKENENLRASVEELKDKLNKNIIVNSLEDEKEIEESRTVIKSLLKEIEGCMAILSNGK